MWIFLFWLFAPEVLGFANHSGVGLDRLDLGGIVFRSVRLKP
ncbi:hypothetical protein HanPI659440_Chr05g0204151 [Helianthus annuus]|nr:hypothetical protein HanPI659440_Chr05g0204151 [Helianthus annuus]